MDKMCGEAARGRLDGRDGRRSISIFGAAGLASLFVFFILDSGFWILTPAPCYAQTSMEYYRDLARKPEATVGDAIHMLARAEGYSGPADIWRELLVLYNEHHIKFRRDITRMADMPLTKGNAAHMLMNAMSVRGWVMQRIFSGSQRYAVREAVYMKLLPPESAVYQKMSGSELMGFVTRLMELKGEQTNGD